MNYHGRGIRLIETLCQRLEFIGSGNSVIVELRPSLPHVEEDDEEVLSSLLSLSSF